MLEVAGPLSLPVEDPVIDVSGPSVTSLVAGDVIPVFVGPSPLEDDVADASLALTLALAGEVELASPSVAEVTAPPSWKQAPTSAAQATKQSGREAAARTPRSNRDVLRRCR